jgi:hypothetical protein
VLATAILGWGFVVAAPAQAAPVSSETTFAAPAGCGSGNLCFWNNSGFNDGPGQLAGTNPNWGVFAHGSCPSGTWDNCVSSLFNNGNTSAANVWRYTNYGGAGACWAKGTGNSNLASVNYPGTSVNMNDTISSNNWASSCG